MEAEAMAPRMVWDRAHAFASLLLLLLLRVAAPTRLLARSDAFALVGERCCRDDRPVDVEVGVCVPPCTLVLSDRPLRIIWNDYFSQLLLADLLEGGACSSWRFGLVCFA